MSSWGCRIFHQVLEVFWDTHGSAGHCVHTVLRLPVQQSRVIPQHILFFLNCFTVKHVINRLLFVRKLTGLLLDAPGGQRKGQKHLCGQNKVEGKPSIFLHFRPQEININKPSFERFLAAVHASLGLSEDSPTQAAFTGPSSCWGPYSFSKLQQFWTFLSLKRFILSLGDRTASYLDSRQTACR